MSTTTSQTTTDIVAKLDTGAAERQAEALNERDPYDVLIVGGGPGRCSGCDLCRAQGYSHRVGG